MTRDTGAVHIADRLNNSNGNKESPNNPSKSLLCGRKGFPFLTVEAIITNVCILEFVSCNQHPSCIHSSTVLSVQHHLKLDETVDCRAAKVKVQ